MRAFRRLERQKSDRTLIQSQGRMVDAITDVLIEEGKQFYDELSDDELYGYARALWDFHTDLRDEWSRREMDRRSPA